MDYPSTIFYANFSIWGPLSFPVDCLLERTVAHELGHLAHLRITGKEGFKETLHYIREGFAELVAQETRARLHSGFRSSVSSTFLRYLCEEYALMANRVRSEAKVTNKSLAKGDWDRVKNLLILSQYRRKKVEEVVLN